MVDNISITLEIEPIVKVHCACFSCKFNMPTGDRVLEGGKSIQEGFCMLKHIILDDSGKCLDKSISTTCDKNSEYYNSRNYDCAGTDERCEARTENLTRCVLPKGHQGKHLTPGETEFD